MSGTVETLRVAGVPSGFPSEIDSSLKVKFVAPVLVNMSDMSVDFLKYIGGPETFRFNQTKVEWVEKDHWTRRVTLASSMTGGVTSMVVTAKSHQFPVGSIFYNKNPNAAGVTHAEWVRVTGHVDANTLTVQREIATSTATSSETWATTDEIVFSGQSMHENDNWVFRPTSVSSMPYNLPQIQQVAVQETWRRSETAFYGMQGSDLDEQAKDTVQQQFVALNNAAVNGQRSAGTSSIPSMAGGVKYYITSSNGSQVTNCSGAAMTRKDIDDLLQALYLEVGGENMAKTVLTSPWGKRKIDSMFSSAERLGPGTGQTAGITVDRLNTAFGVIDVMLHKDVQLDEMLFLRRENHKMGVYGTLGAPQLRQLPPSSTGPRLQTAFYCDWSMINSGPRAEGRIHNFSTSA